MSGDGEWRAKINSSASEVESHSDENDEVYPLITGLTTESSIDNTVVARDIGTVSNVPFRPTTTRVTTFFSIAVVATAICLFLVPPLTAIFSYRKSDAAINIISNSAEPQSGNAGSASPSLNSVTKIPSDQLTISKESCLMNCRNTCQIDPFSRTLKKKECEENDKYSVCTVKTLYETAFGALFQDRKDQAKFEASSVTMANGVIYAICDSSWAISKIDPSMTPFSASHIQIGNPNREPEEDSDYESLFHHGGIFYAVRESIQHRGVTGNGVKSYHAIVEELSLTADNTSYTILDQCRSEYEFEGNSKGFEGAIGFPGLDGKFYILGLCEGNHCSESRKFDSGHGRIILMVKNRSEVSSVRENGQDNKGNECVWKTVREIKIPKSVDFKDYSDIDITASGRVAITSQEDSALWIGQMVGIVNGSMDANVVDFDHSDVDGGMLYSFPKSDSCKTKYCNIEGIHFVSEKIVLAVSDQMKKHGKQNFKCLEKDQSIHVFALP